MAKTAKIHPLETSNYNPLQLQRKCFRILGYYPGDGKFLHWSMVSICLLHYWSQVQLCYGEFQHGWTQIAVGDLFKALEVMTPTLSRVGALLKCFSLIAQRKRLKKFLDKLVALHDGANFNEKPIYEWVTHWSRQFTKFELNFFLVTCIFFSTMPLVVMLFQWFENPNAPWLYLLPTQVSLPYEYRYSPVYELTYLLTTYIVFVPCFMLAGSDGLFIGVSLLVSSQFRVVQQQLEVLRQKVETNSNTENTLQDDFERLKQIAQSHIAAIELSHEMSVLFVWNVFACYTIAAVKLGMTCLIISQADVVVKLIFIFGSLGILTEVYIYSYGGTQISEESKNVGRSAYEFPWYRYDKNVRQLIRMMMMRTQKPSRVEIPFFEASVATFGAIVRTAGSYMTLLQSVLED